MHSLILLLPLVLLYEGAALWSARDDASPHSLWAPEAIQDLLAWFGLVGFWVPPFVFVLTLLLWHRLRGDRWRVRWWVFPGMAAESLLLAVPLWVLSALFAAPPPARLIAALGAAVYEELVFRLLLISGLTWLMIEMAHLWRPAARGSAVVLAALLFAMCHFVPIGSAPFAWKLFGFKAAAGLYLSAVFVGRGLGVAGGCHAIYNLLLAGLSRGAAG